MKDDPDRAAFTERERDIVDFARRLTTLPQDARPEDLDRLRAHGLSDEDLLVLVHVIGYFNHINRLADALGVDLEDDMPPAASSAQAGEP